MKTKPYAMLLMMLAGWINRQQQEAISFLMEENKILKHELLKATGKKQIILNQIQKRRLGILAKRVGRKMLFNNWDPIPLRRGCLSGFVFAVSYFS